MYQNEGLNKRDEFAKDEIIIQAQKLFMQFGLKKTTMDEIAMACGKAKSTLYHYFKNKDEVFDAVLDKEIKSLRTVVNEEVSKQTSLKGILQSYFITFHQETIHRINLYRIIKPELNIELSAKDRFNIVLDFEINYVNSFIEKGIENKELTGIEMEKSRWFTELMLVAFLGIVKHSVNNENEIDIKELNLVAEVLISRLII